MIELRASGADSPGEPEYIRSGFRCLKSSRLVCGVKIMNGPYVSFFDIYISK